MTDREQSLLDHIIECDGAEISSDWWPEAESLVAQGLITLSGAHGPLRMWRRAELIEE